MSIVVKEAAPVVSRAALMFNPDTAPQYYLYLRSFETVPRSIAVEVTAPPVRDTAEIEAAIAKLDRELGGGPIVAPDGFTTVHQLLFIRLAQQHRLPASFVQEGAPIPVHGLTVAGTLLEPRKLAVIVALAAEMLAGSNAEALVTDALTRATGLAIDAALFDFEAADEVRAAGLRRGIAASTASTATSADTAMIEDLATLAGQVAVVGGPITFVTSPARAVVISLLAHRELPFTVLGSPAVAADDFIAVGHAVCGERNGRGA